MAGLEPAESLLASRRKHTEDLVAVGDGHGHAVRRVECVTTPAALHRGDPVRREVRRYEYLRGPRRRASVAAEPRADSAGSSGDGVDLVVTGLRLVEQSIIVPEEDDARRVAAVPAAHA